MSQLIYFDNNATTKVDDRILEAMLPYFSQNYGNASSKLHEFGWIADAAVEKAREQVANLIGAEPNEIIFTSGATEGVNTALKGIFRAYKTKGNHIITVSTEHKSVVDTCEYLKEEGAEITYLNVNKEGLIDMDELRFAIKPTTILISVMAANNETGVIQPMEEISAIAKENKIIFFADATQFAGKTRMDVNDPGIDCICLSAHKFFGPKGIGALYIRRKNPRVNVVSLLHGGAQENYHRAGTLNVPLIVGLGKACEIAQAEMWDNNTEVSKLRAYFEHQILDIDGLRINGSTKFRLYNTSNITFPASFDVKPLFKQFAFSSGSACSSGTAEPSHVLKAMGLADIEIKNSYRFSFGKHNTLDEIRLLTKCLLNGF
ncbi:MAG TPA: cysteine desulfurase family protein [Bacteroidia bacterium]|jgi:cysteine desulfurase|nr:cysteine desulfurase family protein [Bacteroidia bacterium]